jgi:hypothetical protein
MEERRSLERLRPYYYLRVYDDGGDDYVGSVVDISVKGIRMVGESRFRVSKKYTFTMKLPEGSFFGDSVRVAAECRWCKENGDDGSFETGFRFKKDVHQGVFTIKGIVDDLRSRKMI